MNALRCLNLSGALLVIALMMTACEREVRDFRVEPHAATTAPAPVNSELRAGSITRFPSATQAAATQPSTQTATTRPGETTQAAATQSAAAQQAASQAPNPSVTTYRRIDYQNSAYAMAEGKRYYISFNCVGCHAMGGGGMGPPHIDSEWKYGSELEQIFASIVEGRPNGMPSFRNKIPEYQVWQIAAYVRSIAGLARKDAAPARSDHMKTKPPENSMDRQPPKLAPWPKPPQPAGERRS